MSELQRQCEEPQLGLSSASARPQLPPTTKGHPGLSPTEQPAQEQPRHDSFSLVRHINELDSHLRHILRRPSFPRELGISQFSTPLGE